MKIEVFINLDMINNFEKERLIKLFGTRIGLALCRADVTYGKLCDWYFSDILKRKLLKIRGIGKFSAYYICFTFENHLLSCL